VHDVVLRLAPAELLRNRDPRHPPPFRLGQHAASPLCDMDMFRQRRYDRHSIRFVIGRHPQREAQGWELRSPLRARPPDEFVDVTKFQGV
jgi:hypothetical protein